MVQLTVVSGVLLLLDLAQVVANKRRSEAWGYESSEESSLGHIGRAAPDFGGGGSAHNIDDALRRKRGRTVLYLKRKIIIIPPDIAANVELQKKRCNESL